MEHQQEKETSLRDLQTVREQLETERAKRMQLEKSATNQKAEIARLSDRSVKLDKELNKALKDLKDKEWEIKQLESKQDKTIVEHVHVLEEAKRVTDRQLIEVQIELEKMKTYARSLQMAKSKMQGEAEDLSLKYVRELKSREQDIKDQEKKTTETLANLEKERRAKEEAELHNYRVQTELQQARQQAEELSERLVATERSKHALEDELERLVEESTSSDSLAKVQRTYESRIAELETELDESEMAKVTALNIRDQIERQHAEIRNMVLTSSPLDKDFHSKLLREFQRSEDALKRRMSIRPNHPRLSGTRSLHPKSTTHTSPRKSLGSSQSPDSAKPSRDAGTKVTVLKQHVECLQAQMVASTRVRQHLETTVRELTVELAKSDGSKQSLEKYKVRLVKENEKLSRLLQDESNARRAAEAAQVVDVQAMWVKFQGALTDERESCIRLEESRKALVS